MSETTPAARDTGVVEGAPTGAAAAGADAPASPVQKLKCMICGEREATFVQQFGPNPAGKMLKLRFCDTCTPSFVNRENDGVNGKADKPKRKKTKNRIATTDYTAPISAILYRLGGCTLEQAGRWLWLYMPEVFLIEAAAREAAGRTLRVMREQGQVEVVSIRRLWMGESKRHGRRENFFRLSRARSGAAIVEGAAAADEDPAQALIAYRRPWKSGGLDHAAHRADLYLLFAEEANAREDVSIDPETMYSETHRDYPYYGAKAVQKDNGGEKLSLKKTSRRKYEEVTADGEFVGEFSVTIGENEHVFESAFLLELERRTNASKVIEKIQKYAGYWERHLFVLSDNAAKDAKGEEQRRQALFARENRIRPIIIVHHDTREARVMGRKAGTGVEAMCQTVGDRLYANKTGHFARLAARLTLDYDMSEYFLGRCILFVEWEDIRNSTDPFSLHYYPVSAYQPKVHGELVSKDGKLTTLAAAAVEQQRLPLTMAKEKEEA